MLAELDPTRLEDFARRLTSHPRNRVDQRTLWAAFAAAFPVDLRAWKSVAGCGPPWTNSLIAACFGCPQFGGAAGTVPWELRFRRP
jgi:hypothetical protein